MQPSCLFLIFYLILHNIHKNPTPGLARTLSLSLFNPNSLYDEAHLEVRPSWFPNRPNKWSTINLCVNIALFRWLTFSIRVGQSTPPAQGSYPGRDEQNVSPHFMMARFCYYIMHRLSYWSSWDMQQIGSLCSFFLWLTCMHWHEENCAPSLWLPSGYRKGRSPMFW